MKEEILLHRNDPQQLERLYRADKSAFRRAFRALLPELEESPLIRFWNARLNFAKEEVTWGTGKDLVFVIIASLFAGLIAKLPAILQIDEEFFYTRNAGFIIFPMLSAYFAWKNNLSTGKVALIAGTTLAGLVFINTLPYTAQSDTLLLSCIHLIFLLWAVSGLAFIGEAKNNVEKRLGYLKYSGDLVVMTTLIVIAGAIMTVLTIGLFSLIGFDIETFFFEYVVIAGLPAAPIAGTWLIRNNPQLVGKVSPVIAKIFSPLVLVMLVIYLIAIIYSGKDPYNDREFLIMFNALLVGVMAIIFFSIAEASGTTKTQMEIWVLLLLSVLTIIVNGIALSAILFRISEWGITPNRAAVLGGNVLILLNLVLVTGQLFKALSRKTEIAGVGKTISSYLPVYLVWVAIVTFLFPFLFGFK